MQLIQIDAVEAQPSETSFESLLKMTRPAVWHPLTRARASETALRRNDQPFRIRIKRFSDKQFACVRTVCVGSVDQIHAKLYSAFEKFQRVLSIGRPSPDASSCDTHSAKA